MATQTATAPALTAKIQPSDAATMNLAAAMLQTGKVRMASASGSTGGGMVDESTATEFASAILSGNDVLEIGALEISPVVTPRLVGDEKINLPDGRYDAFRRCKFKTAGGVIATVKCKLNVVAAVKAGEKVSFSIGTMNDKTKFWIAAHTAYVPTEAELNAAIDFDTV